ncbi:MerC domain-containing protein [Sphingomonas sp. ASV193]|uniref:MerC domain-containing protein n=1 Tax=Sphingomonas sp. ASV193 TaxID=3144405 RepID=UPI0032E8E4E7
MAVVLAISTSRIDRWAVGLSGLCLVHCLGTAILFALVATTGGLLGKPVIHEVGLAFAMLLGTIALGRGIVEHGYSMPSMVGAFGLGVMAGALSLPEGGMEPVYTVLGVSILALGHRLNHLAAE